MATLQDKVSLVMSTWELCVPIAHVAANIFYDRLFELDPSLRQLFPIDMMYQKVKIMKLLTVVVRGLCNLAENIDKIRDLALRHVTYGVKITMYGTVRAALLYTLEKGLGIHWTPDVADAWATVYTILSKIMTDVYDPAEQSQLSLMTITPRHNVCYSLSCSEKSSWNKIKCYSPACRKAQRPPSYWKHPKLRKMIVKLQVVFRLKYFNRLRAFSSFLPTQVILHLNNCQQSRTAGPIVLTSSAKVTPGAVLFADASGFTKLTERLSTAANGVERLCEIINGFFETLVNIVTSHGGDVVKFAGDAMCIMWCVKTEQTKSNIPTMTAAILAATNCSIALHRALHNYKALDGPNPCTLSLHIGIGSGDITLLHLGGMLNRWEFVIAGPPLAEIAIAEPLAEPGETVMAPLTYELVKDQVNVTSLEELSKLHQARFACLPEEHKSFVRVESLRDASGPLLQDDDRKKITYENLSSNFRFYIPAAIHTRLTAGQTGHLAEMRDVSVVFVHIHLSAKTVSDPGFLPECQKAILMVQQNVYYFEGSLNKILIDDKGFLILAVFGLPPLYHRDDSCRAVGAAKSIMECSKQSSTKFSIGVTTGTAFCGIVGSAARGEYTVMGGVVNLAARLMANSPVNEILVCATTLSKCPYLRVTVMPPLLLKGFEKPYTCFSILGAEISQEERLAQVASNASSLNNGEEGLALQHRQSELAGIRSFFLSKNMGELIILTGIRGSGKSAFVEALRKMGEEFKMTVPQEKSSLRKSVKKDMAAVPEELLEGYSDNAMASNSADTFNPAHLSSSLYQDWKGIVFYIVSRQNKLLDLGLAAQVLSILPAKFHHHAALLNFVAPEFGIPWPKMTDVQKELMSLRKKSSAALFARAIPLSENNLSIYELNSQQIIAVLQEMILVILKRHMSMFSTLLVLHLQTGTSMQPVTSPESWKLAYEVAEISVNRTETEPKLIFCVVSRPVVSFAPIEFKEIIGLARDRQSLIQLKGLPRHKINQYVADFLNLDLVHIPAAVLDFVAATTAGNPINIEEIINQMIFQKAIKVDAGSQRLIVYAENFDHVEIPMKLVGQIVSFIDLLKPLSQLIVKLASTFQASVLINPGFSLYQIRAVFPYRDLVHTLPTAMLELVESGVFEARLGQTGKGDIITYSFLSQVLRDQANKLLLEAHRNSFRKKKVSGLEIRPFCQVTEI